MTKPGRLWSLIDQCQIRELDPVGYRRVWQVSLFLCTAGQIIQSHGDSRTKTLPDSETNCLMQAGGGLETWPWLYHSPYNCVSTFLTTSVP